MLDNKCNPKLDKTQEARYDKISAFRKYAEVAQASYCLKLKTNMGSVENDGDFINALSDKGYSQHFSKEQAKRFAKEHQVMAHYEMPKGNRGYKEIASNITNFINDDSFSATLFLDKETKDYILAFRGTEGSFDGIDKINNAIRDFYTDFLLAANEIPNQYFTLIDFFENTIKNIIGNNKIVVVGHSLGGFLAQSFVLTYPHIIKEAYTYNSPGLLPDDRKYILEGTKIAIGVANKLYKVVKDIKNGNLKSAITNSSEAVDKISSYSLFSDRYNYRALIVTNELKSLTFIDGLFDKYQNILPSHVTNAILESYNFGNTCLFFGYGIYVCMPTFFLTHNTSRYDINNLTTYSKKLYSAIQNARIGDLILFNMALSSGDYNKKVINDEIKIIKHDESPNIAYLYANIGLAMQDNKYPDNTITQENVYHIETDNDNDPSNNGMIENLTADLGEDIPGYKYYVNLGNCEEAKGIVSHSIIYLAQALSIAETQTKNTDRSLYDINAKELNHFCNKIKYLSLSQYQLLDYYAKNNINRLKTT